MSGLTMGAGAAAGSSAIPAFSSSQPLPIHLDVFAEAEALEKDLARKVGSSITVAKFLQLIRSDAALPNARERHSVFLLFAIQHSCFDAIEELLKDHKPYITPAMINWGNCYRNTPLLLAVANQKTELVRLLLAHGADPEISSLDKTTPLLFAASLGNLSILNLLLEHGTKVDAVGSSIGETALSFAVNHCSYPKIIARLLDAGADPHVRTRYGMDLLTCALQKCNPQVIKLLFKKTPFLIQTKHLPRMMCFAVEENQLEMLKVLLARAHKIAPRFLNDDTLLMRSIRNNTPAISKFLLAHNPPPQLNSRNEEGDTALTLAVKKKKIDLITPLLAMRNPDGTHQDQAHNNALISAASQDDLEIFKLLLLNGAALTPGLRAHIKSLQTPSPAVKKYFDYFEAQEATWTTHRSPHHALPFNKKALAEIADRQLEDPAYFKDQNTVFEPMSAELLTKKISPWDFKTLPEDQLVFFLTLAIEKKASELLILKLLEGLQSLRVNLDRPLEKYDCSALVLAVHAQSISAVRALLAAGANPNQPCPHTHKTLLKVAVDAGNLELVACLIQQIPELKLRALLLRAAEKNNLALCALLIGHGARVDNLKDFEKFPPSFKENYFEIILPALSGVGPLFSLDQKLLTPSKVSKASKAVALQLVLAEIRNASPDQLVNIASTARPYFLRARSWESRAAAFFLRRPIGSLEKFEQAVKKRAEELATLPVRPMQLPMKLPVKLPVKLKVEGKINISGASETLPTKTSNIRGFNLQEATPLRTAACDRHGYGNLDEVKRLISSGVDVNRGSPLEIAACGGKLKIVEALLEAGADPDQLTPLISATCNGHKPVVIALLKAGALVDKACHSGPRAIDFALWNGYDSIAKILIEAGADTTPKNLYFSGDRVDASLRRVIFLLNTSLPKSSKLVVEPAVVSVAAPAIKTLVPKKMMEPEEVAKPELAGSASADSHVSDITAGAGAAAGSSEMPAVSSFQPLPIHLDVFAEAEALKKDLARKFGSSITSAEFLAVIRSDTTLPNSRNQQTIFLLLAIQHHFFDAIEELLKYHKPYLTPAMINWLNSAGETVLIQAIALEKTQLVRLLLAHGADPDISSFSHHITPLMLAADRNNVEILELLLQCGVKAVSETASFAIEHNRDPAIIARLLEAATVSAEIPAAPAAPAALSTGAGAAAGSSDRPAAVSSSVTPEHMPPKELTEPKEEADNTGAEEWEIVPSDVSEPTQPPAAPTSFFSYFGLWRSSASQGPAGTGSGASDRTI